MPSGPFGETHAAGAGLVALAGGVSIVLERAGPGGTSRGKTASPGPASDGSGSVPAVEAASGPAGRGRAGWNILGGRGRHHPARRLVGQVASLPRELPAAGRMPFAVNRICPVRPFPGLPCLRFGPAAAQAPGHHRTTRWDLSCPLLGGADGHGDDLGGLPPGRARQVTAAGGQRAGRPQQWPRPRPCRCRTGPGAGNIGSIRLEGARRQRAHHGILSPRDPPRQIAS